MSMTTKTAVSQRALLARINRRLARSCESIRLCRPSSRWFGDLGRVYSVDHVRNQINGSHIDLESRGRELEF